MSSNFVQNYLGEQLAQRTPSVNRPRVRAPSPFDDTRMDISDRFRPKAAPASPSSFVGSRESDDRDITYTGDINVTGLGGDVADQFSGLTSGIRTALGPLGLAAIASIGGGITQGSLTRIQDKMRQGIPGYGIGMLNGRIVGVSPGGALTGVLPAGLSGLQRQQIANQLLQMNPTTALVGGLIPTKDDPDTPPPTATASVVDQILSGIDPEAAGYEAGLFSDTLGGTVTGRADAYVGQQGGIEPPAAPSVSPVDYYPTADDVINDPYRDVPPGLAVMTEQDFNFGYDPPGDYSYFGDVTSPASQPSDDGGGAPPAAQSEPEDDSNPEDYGGSSTSFSDTGGFGPAGFRAKGGRVGMADGGSADPVQGNGFVEGSPDNYTKKQTIADDEYRRVRPGSFIMNAPMTEKLQEAGLLPKGVDNPAKKSTIKANKGGMIDVALSKGEYVFEPEEAREIGYDVLNKINDMGKSEVDRRQAMGHGGMTGTKEEIEGVFEPRMLTDEAAARYEETFNIDTILDNRDVEYTAPEKLPTSIFPYSPDIRAAEDFNKDVVTVSDVLAGYATSRQLGQNKNSAFYKYKQHIDGLRATPVEYVPGKSEFDGVYKFPPLTSKQQNVLDSVESMLDFNLEQARLNKEMSAYAPSPDEDFVATAYTQTGSDRMRQFYQRGFNQIFAGQGSRPELVDTLTQLPYIDRYATNIDAGGQYSYADDALEVNPDVVPSFLYELYDVEPPMYADTMRTVEVHELEHMGFDKAVRRNLPFISVREAAEFTSIGRNPDRYVPIEVQQAKEAAYERYKSIPSENRTEKDAAFDDWMDTVDEYDAHIPDQNHAAMMVYNTSRILNATANMPLKEKVLNRLNLVSTSLGYIPKGNRKQAIADRHSAMKQAYPELYAFLDSEKVIEREKESLYIGSFTYEGYVRNASELPDKVLEQLDEFTDKYLRYMAQTYHAPVSAELRAAMQAKEVDNLPEGSRLRAEAERRLSPENLKESYETYSQYFLNNDRYTQFPLSRRVEGLAATR